MTLRERLHHQIDALDAEQLAALDALLSQLARPLRVKGAASGSLLAPYVRAQRLMAGQPGFAQEIIDSREGEQRAARLATTAGEPSLAKRVASPYAHGLPPNAGWSTP